MEKRGKGIRPEESDGKWKLAGILSRGVRTNSGQPVSASRAARCREMGSRDMKRTAAAAKDGTVPADGEEMEPRQMAMKEQDLSSSAAKN